MGDETIAVKSEEISDTSKSEPSMDVDNSGENASVGSQTMQPISGNGEESDKDMDGKDLDGNGNDGNIAGGDTGEEELTEEEKKQREAKEKEREREEVEKEEERKKAEEAKKAAEERMKTNLALAEKKKLEAENEAEALEAEAEEAKARQEAAEKEVVEQRKKVEEGEAATKVVEKAREKAEAAVEKLRSATIAAEEAAEKAREKASAAEKAEKTRKDAESKKKEATEAATKAAEAAKAVAEGQMDEAEGEEGKKKLEEAERLKGIAEEAAKRAEEAEEKAKQAEAEAKKAAEEAEEAKKAAEEERKEKEEEAAKEKNEMVRLEGLVEDKKEAEKAIPEKLGEAAKAEKEKNAAQMKAAGKRKAAEAAEEFGKTKAADLGEDDFKTALLDMMIEAGGVDVRHEEEEGDDRKFDTLSDLKNLPQDTDNTDNTDNMDEGEGDKQKDKDLQEKRKQVNKLRRGNLYKAVIISRILKPENADENYDGAEELKAQKEKAEKQGEKSSRFSRFSRFMNSSEVDKGFDIVGKANKTVGAVSGIAALASGSYKKSGLFTGISIASDVITMVCTVRGIMKKVKALKGKAASGSEKALAIVGLASDIFTILAKIASLTQSIGGLHKMSDANKRIARIVQDACTLASQATGMAGICDSLRKTVNGKKKLEGEQDKAKNEVEAIVRKAMGQDAPENGKGDEQESKDTKEEHDSDGESKEGEVSGKAPLEKGASEKETLKQPKGRRRLKKKEAPNKKLEEDLPNQVVKALNNPNNNLSEDEKETLLSYLIREKLISKKERAIVTTAAGLITNVIGMGSVITKEVSSETNSSDGSKTNEAASTANTVFGALSNAFVIGTNAIMPVTGAIADKASQGDEEARLIKDGLWNALSSLGKDEYGLRGIANGLDSKEKKDYNAAKAENAVKKYETVEKQLSSAGVDYNKLFAATNLEKFKNALVAGL